MWPQFLTFFGCVYILNTIVSLQTNDHHFVHEWQHVDGTTLINLSRNSEHTYHLVITLLHEEDTCQMPYPGSLSPSNATEAAILLYGQDEILIHLAGKTLQSHIAEYHRCGQYQQHFDVVISGFYHMKV